MRKSTIGASSSADRWRRPADFNSLLITSFRACFQMRTLPPNRNTARHSKSWRRRASEYETTTDSWKSFQNLFLQLSSAMACARWCCGGGGGGGALARLARAAYRAARSAASVARVSAYCAWARAACQVGGGTWAGAGFPWPGRGSLGLGRGPGSLTPTLGS